METLIGIVLIGCVMLILWLASRTTLLEEQVAKLDNEVRLANRRIGLLSKFPTLETPVHAGTSAGMEVEPAPSTASAAPVPPRRERAARPSVLSEMQALSAPVVEELAPGVGAVRQVAEDLAAASSSSQPTWLERWLARAGTTDEWEALIGGNWLNRIGALALILGVSFFMKYAFDNNWISPVERVAIGVAVGAGLLSLAYRTLGRGYLIFAQGLVGAGLAILYISVYASYNFYHLVPLYGAFVALGIVIAIGFGQSLYYDSLVVALLAWGGGFLTPFMLGVSGGSALGVIVYVVLLDVGILGIVIRRDEWVVLEALSLGATYVVYVSWFLTEYEQNQIVTAAVALTLFWLVFYAIDAWRIGTGARTFTATRAQVASANTITYYGLMFLLVFPSNHVAMGLITLGIGVAYFATILVIRRSLQDGNAVDARFTLTAVVLLVIATSLVTSGFATIVVWSLEAGGMLWCGIRWNLRYVWQPALVLYGIAAAWLSAVPGALAYSPIDEFIPLLNLRFLAFSALGVSLAGGAVLVRRLQDSHARSICTSLQYGWCGVGFILLTVEANDTFLRAMVGVGGERLTEIGYWRFLALSAGWTLFSVPFVWFGLLRRNLPLLTSGLGAVALAIGLDAVTAAAYQPVQRYIPVLNLRAGVTVLVIVVLFVHYRRLSRTPQELDWLATVRVVIQAAIILLGFELMTAEVNDYFAYRSGGATQTTHDVGLFVEFVALGILWMAYSLFLVWNGVRKMSQTLLVAGLGCAGVAIGAGAYCGFAAQPSSRLPLVLGTRAVMLPLLMLSLYLHMRWTKDASRLYRWLDTVLAAFQAAIVILGFELITGETRDFFDHVASTSPRTLTDSSHLRNLEELTLSGLWLLYAIALMAVGLWRRTRWMRVGSIGLFGFIVLKVFIYDLTFLAGPYRSASFVALGVILLAVSYLYGRYRGVLLEA